MTNITSITNLQRKEQLLRLRAKHNRQLTKLHITKDAIQNLKAGCPHDYKYIGHGHKEDYYECWICKELTSE